MYYPWAHYQHFEGMHHVPIENEGVRYKPHTCGYFSVSGVSLPNLCFFSLFSQENTGVISRSVERALMLLEQAQGTLVSIPLRFLEEEDLLPDLWCGEHYAPKEPVYMTWGILLEHGFIFFSVTNCCTVLLCARRWCHRPKAVYLCFVDVMFIQCSDHSTCIIIKSGEKYMYRL